MAIEQAIDMGDVESPAPSRSPLQRVPTPPRQSPTDKMIESALDFLGGEGGDKPEKKPKPDAEPPDELPREAPLPKKADPDADDDLDDDDGDDDEAGELDDSEDDEPESSRGSEADPFTIQDLPDNKFIELKVDGQKEKVSLKELASGYIRESTFNQRINKTKALADEAGALAEKAKGVQDHFRTEFTKWVNDSKSIYNFFMGHSDRERVFHEAAQMYAQQIRRFRENPIERVTWEKQREMDRLQNERDAFEQQKRAELERRQREDNERQATAIFNPGWAAGLKKAGFPTPTRELWDEVMVRCSQKIRSGQSVSSEDVETYTYRACKLLELQPANAQAARPKPAPVSSKPRERVSRKASEDKWQGLPSHKKVRDPDFFLRGLRDRDLR